MVGGVTALKRKNKDVIRLAFSYRGVQCRETLDLPPTKPNLLYAQRLRAEIQAKIERGTFRYDEYFPDSPKCRTFGHGAGKTGTVAALLTDYLKRAKQVLQPSTFTGYRKAVENVLIPKFGTIQLGALSAGVLREWIAEQKVTQKRMANLLLPLRNALTEAVADEILPFNPLDRLKLARILPRETVESDYEPDPYTMDELRALMGVLTGAERHTFQFWAFTGVRTSELIGINWPDFEGELAALQVQRAVVEGKEKVTKTKAGTRRMPLLPAARQAASAQRALTGLKGGRVFLNPRTGEDWTDQALLRVWQRANKLARTRYRNPYQLRHTFASQLLSQGQNPAYIAKLLGHKTTEMVMRHYGRWVEQGTELGFERPPEPYGSKTLAGLPALPSDQPARVKNV